MGSYRDLIALQEVAKERTLKFSFEILLFNYGIVRKL